MLQPQADPHSVCATSTTKRSFASCCSGVIGFPVSTLAETQGDINASGPPMVEPGGYVVQLPKDTIGTRNPYDAEASAPFTIS